VSGFVEGARKMLKIVTVFFELHSMPNGLSKTASRKSQRGWGKGYSNVR